MAPLAGFPVYKFRASEWIADNTLVPSGYFVSFNFLHHAKLGRSDILPLMPGTATAVRIARQEDLHFWNPNRSIACW